MTEPLSPAAQAVLEASAKHWAGTRTQAIAAALEAAAEQLGYGKTDDLVVSCEDLLAIAAELEAQ